MISVFSAGSRQRDQPLLTMACGLREPQQFTASELYKYYHMSACHVRGRVRSPETFRLPGTKDISPMALNLSLSISASSFPCTHLCFSHWDPCVTRDESQGVGRWRIKTTGQMWPVLLTSSFSVMLLCLIQPAHSAIPSCSCYGPPPTCQAPC